MASHLYTVRYAGIHRHSKITVRDAVYAVKFRGNCINGGPAGAVRGSGFRGDYKNYLVGQRRKSYL